MGQLSLDIRTEAVAGEMLSDEDDDGTPLAQIKSRINESSTPRLFKEISEVDVELADPFHAQVGNLHSAKAAIWI
jgi:hypothetical protein